MLLPLDVITVPCYCHSTFFYVESNKDDLCFANIYLVVFLYAWMTRTQHIFVSIVFFFITKNYEEKSGSCFISQIKNVMWKQISSYLL